MSSTEALRAFYFNLIETHTPEDIRKVLAKASGRRRGIIEDVGSSLYCRAVSRIKSAYEVCTILLANRIPCNEIPYEKRVHEAGSDLSDFKGALHCAAHRGQVRCLEVLVKAKCDLEQRDRHGGTPLFVAMARNQTGAMKKLLEIGAELLNTAQNTEFPTALNMPSRADTVIEALLWHAKKCVELPTAEQWSSMLEQHQRKGHDAVVHIFNACHEAWALGCKTSWALRKDQDRLSAYATLRAQGRDVAALCKLEDEFIEDHRHILADGMQDDVFFEQIGLRHDAASRRRTIKSLSQGLEQTAPVRHYTLVCRHLKPPSRIPEQADGNGKRLPGGQTIGYIYFKICDGTRGDGEAASDDEEQVVDRKTSATPGVGYLVISHIKVSHAHTKRGVAHLLLAAALRKACELQPELECRTMHLSVSERNVPAMTLYKSIGFKASATRCKHEGWVSMERRIDDSIAGVPGGAAAMATSLQHLGWRRAMSSRPPSAATGVDVLPDLLAPQSSPPEGSPSSADEKAGSALTDAELDAGPLASAKRRRMTPPQESESVASEASTSAGSTTSKASFASVFSPPRARVTP
eukprot:TRINITY_DN16955_c0_g1_i1.p1 TRINITY_DN16955_c0_g1~~TRINITY_DN16955_c0_g1_i1.p1  ORF type:complete len:579 (-),score=84.15 TRINITY_DN16955_c0_g1_i1:43-1779(-)